MKKKKMFKMVPQKGVISLNVKFHLNGFLPNLREFQITKHE